MELQHPGSTRMRHRLAFIGLAVATVAVLAGCASTTTATTTGSFTPVKQSKSSAITVWVDSTRLPAAKLFQKDNPTIPINIVTYDGGATGNTFQTKVGLFNKAGSGWPDVVFDENLTDIGWASSGKDPYAAPLNKGIFPSAKLANFSPTSLDPCTVNGTVYCIRNDVGQDVLWYNKTLMDKFGYTVPTTWEQFEALSDTVSKEHPGYQMGQVGDQNAVDIYFWAAECPAQVLHGTTFSSNTGAPDCVRMAKLLDAMIANGTMSTEAAMSGTAYPKQYSSKTLMTVGPSWYGQYFFADTLNVPKGQIAAADPLTWASQSKSYTGNVGGGTWFLSSHSKNLAAASKFIDFETTSEAVQADAPTYPAYAPAAAQWIANPANSSYFANDVSGPLKDAAADVWPGWAGDAQVSQENIWSTTVMTKVLAGATIQDTLPAWQTEALNLAPTVGYTVKK
jgi:ABC-type glycerol-3-phosphate transport system substrate-binding protein